MNAQIPIELSEYIAARAERLDWKKAKFVAEIINYWASKGCPPVSYADGKLDPLPFKGAKPKKGKTVGPAIGESAPAHHEQHR